MINIRWTQESATGSVTLTFRTDRLEETVTLRLADPEADALDDLVASTHRQLVAPSAQHGRTVLRSRLDEDGVVGVPGFLTADAVAELLDECRRLEPWAGVRTDHRSVFGRREADPRLGSTWVAGHLTRDMFPPHSVAQRLYVSPVFKQLVASIVGVTHVYEYADPLAGLVCTVLPPGGCYGWHYDTNEFVVTIAVGQPERGGEFEYVPDLRSPGHENLEGARRIVAGLDRDHVRSVCAQPGDLQLFRGRYSLHRVAPVEGDRPRFTLVLSYSDRPGVIGPLDRTRRVYGRVTEQHLLAANGRLAADGLAL